MPRNPTRQPSYDRSRASTLITLQHNSGFVHAVNAGIAAARGEFIVLLNNDTVVTPGWLDALVDRAKSDRRVGVVGAKLVYPDGRLQEAGGIVWRDGSAWNYGRYNDPDDPAYTLLADVDYCSGACLLVRADILNTLGGLDTRYVPAYYEDADLAFATRELGFRVVYEPKAVVCHIEGATSGRDIRTGAKRYQEVNQEDFRINGSPAGNPAPSRPCPGSTGQLEDAGRAGPRY